MNKLNKVIATILKETSKENANIRHSPAGKMLQIGSKASRDFYLGEMIPKEFAEAHINGDLHIHDLDYYSKTLTCIHIPLKKLLMSGFNTGNGFIRPPKRFSSAVALAAIILQSEQNDQHGGVSYLNFDHDLEDFVELERAGITKEMAQFLERFGDVEFTIEDPMVKTAIEEKLYKVVFQTMEAFIHNMNSMHSRAGNQVPFSSINLGTATSINGRMVIRATLEAFSKGLGKHEIPIWPQVIFRLKKGINRYELDPNYDLRLLAESITANSINPTYLNLDASFNLPYGLGAGAMGCRTRVCADIHGIPGGEGKGNLSFSTLNLPRYALRKMHITDKTERIAAFYGELDKWIDTGIRQLVERYRVQCLLKANDLPFMIGQGIYVDSDNIKSHESIEPAIKHGTLSLGFVGLAECLTALTGKHHGQSQESQELGLRIVKHIRAALDQATKDYNLNFSLLATPAEGLSYRFSRINRETFGVIEGITDRDYITNSNHVPVHYDISAWDKIRIEAPYHALCNAGHISYIEYPASPKHNPAAVHDVVEAMCDADMGYFGVNHPSDTCYDCGARGTFNGNNCPVCDSTDIIMVRKVTGYLGFLRDFNQGKTAEEANRHGHSL